MQKLALASILAFAMSTSLAIAQVSPGGTGATGNTDDPITGFDPEKGFVSGSQAFVDEQGSLRDEPSARSAFTAMSAEEQQSVRDTCAAYRASGQDNVEVRYTTPAAGAYNMTASCDMVDSW